MCHVMRDSFPATMCSIKECVCLRVCSGSPAADWRAEAAAGGALQAGGSVCDGAHPDSGGNEG